MSFHNTRAKRALSQVERLPSRSSAKWAGSTTPGKVWQRVRKKHQQKDGKTKVPSLYLVRVVELCVSGFGIKWWQDLDQTDTASFIIIIHHSLSAKPPRHRGLHTWTSSVGVFIFKFRHLAVSRPSPWPVCPDEIMFSVSGRAVQILGKSKNFFF